MVSEEHCVVLLMAGSDQDGVLIGKYLASVDNTTEICVEKDCSAILEYLNNNVQAATSDVYFRPRLIILCIRELSADVVGVLEFLQQNTDTAKIPVLIFSESSASGDIKKAYNLKVNSYLHKPDNPDDFAEILKEVAEYWLKWNQLPS